MLFWAFQYLDVLLGPPDPVLDPLVAWLAAVRLQATAAAHLPAAAASENRVRTSPANCFRFAHPAEATWGLGVLGALEYRGLRGFERGLEKA